MAVKNAYHDIEAFIVLLREQIVVQDVRFLQGYFEILSGNFILWIYLPNTEKKQADSEVRAIHLDYDEILSSPQKIIMRLRGLQGMGSRIYARQTVVARIDKKVALEFQNEYHLQYALPGKYRYGLFFQGELVSVAIFSGGRNRYDQEKEYRSFELLRFCHKGDLAVVGGISKLIKAFVKDFNPQDIMTYSDRDWSRESSLETIGFEEVELIPPQSFYIYGSHRKKSLILDETYDYVVQNRGSIKLKLFL